MHAALGDTLFAFVEQDQLWLSPTYHKQADWWQVPLDQASWRQLGSLDYAYTLVETYLRVHPAELQRVGRAQILSVLLRILDTVDDEAS
ncbi:hypothetical protein [Hymenobacter sp. GOD-10R]|uniref:hypothetical protein n=1 Tax=Hymenobacter sp. GOD-10R TaxID=3093922 RepID=UPI002D770367|nr:hypothetical protein [Hymenobacter sp. GOD-10R]WRQ31744.1 hypothetical protein SD425_28955 [Hymenobacter sp. GOD-10R]